MKMRKKILGNKIIIAFTLIFLVFSFLNIKLIDDDFHSLSRNYEELKVKDTSFNDKNKVLKNPVSIEEEVPTTGTATGITESKIDISSISYTSFKVNAKIEFEEEELPLSAYVIYGWSTNGMVWESNEMTESGKISFTVDNLTEGQWYENISFQLYDAEDKTKPIGNISYTGQTIRTLFNASSVIGIENANIVDGTVSSDSFQIKANIISDGTSLVNPYKVQVTAYYYNFKNKVIWTSKGSEKAPEDAVTFNIDNLISGTSYTNIKIQLTTIDGELIGSPTENLGNVNLEDGGFENIKEIYNPSFSDITSSSFLVTLETKTKEEDDDLEVNPYKVIVTESVPVPEDEGKFEDKEITTSKVFNHSGKISFYVKNLIPETKYVDIKLQLFSFDVWTKKNEQPISKKFDTKEDVFTHSNNDKDKLSIGSIIGIVISVLLLVIFAIIAIIIVLRKKEKVI